MKMIGLLAAWTLAFCVSANAQTKTKDYSERIIVADGPTWTYCINMSARAHDCVLKPDPNRPCPDGYGIGGVVWATKAAACAAAQQVTACSDSHGARGC